MVDKTVYSRIIFFIYLQREDEREFGMFWSFMVNFLRIREQKEAAEKK